MAKLLEIAQLGNPILRQVARPVENISAPSIQKLINSLMSTVSIANGVGIAAPQVSESYRLFIVASRPNSRYPNAPLMKPLVIINPKITGHSEEMVKGWEGCLSIPGIRGLVPRYRTIEVEYLSVDGTLHRQEFTDFVARIFQHELDHIDGIVFVDRLETTLDMFTEQEYQKLNK